MDQRYEREGEEWEREWEREGRQRVHRGEGERGYHKTEGNTKTTPQEIRERFHKNTAYL